MTDSMDLSRWPAPKEGETQEQLKVMLAGKPYLAVDPYLMRLREEMSYKMFEYNAERSGEKRQELLANLATLRKPEGKPQNTHIMPPFTFEYGFTLNLGYDIYVGPNATFLDVNEIYIGDRTMIGANCQLYTPDHPLSPEARNGLSGPEWAKTIRIGDDCWLGGGVVIVPGITIGNGVTIGAGSVVTKDIPDRCVAVGNPARIIKRINADGTTENVPKA